VSLTAFSRLGVWRHVFVLFALLGVGAVQGEERDPCERAGRELIVKWRSLPAHLDAGCLSANLAARVQAVRRALPESKRTANGLERVSVITAVSEQDVTSLLSALRSDPRVEYAELRALRTTDGGPTDPRGRGSLDGTPDDPFYAHQWDLPAIEAEAAWNITRGDPSVVIAVVDVGVDFSHPELSHARWCNEAELFGMPGVDDDGNGFVDDSCGYDFVDLDGDPSPFPREPAQTHGTHVAGIAAAARNNGEGIAGLAPDCRVMAVRVGQGDHIPYGFEGVYYAAHSGARVINCSWGGSGESAYERDIVRDAFDQGAVVVASAGNDHSPLPHFPAGIEGVLSVAATQIGDVAAPFTNYGPWVKVSAPGVQILSTIMLPGGLPGYGNFQGTSMSAPLVAAECALVAGRWPQMSSRSIMARVVSSCDPIDAINSGRVGGLGLGRINVWRALSDSVSGVRLAAVEYEESSGNGDGRVRGGESALLRLAIDNDLTDAGEVVGYVYLNDDSASITVPVALFGEVPAGGPYWSTTPVTVTLAPEVQRGHFVPLSVDFTGAFGRLIGRATADVYLDSSWVNVGNGRLTLGFADNGSLGYYDYLRNAYLGAGLRLSVRTNALYHGSFVLASDGVVVDNAYGDSTASRMDWVVFPDSVAALLPSSRADVEAHTTFEEADTPNPLFALVNAAALEWRGENENRFVILEYRMKNRSVNTWNEVYAGLILDWDLAAADGNVAAYDSVSGTAYVRQIIPGHPLAGAIALTDPWSSFYTADNETEIHTRAWSDARKWQILQGGIVPPPTEPRDITIVSGVGPLQIEGLSERTVAFALVEGNDLDDLRAQVSVARRHYSARRALPPASPAPSVRAELVPNPLPCGESLRLFLPREERATVSIYNVLGQRVAEFAQVSGGVHGAVLDARALNGASGLLFYRIESPNVRRTGKILILK
jgi:serine protease